MKNTLKDWLVLSALVSTASLATACGGGKDDEESEPSGPSLSSIAGKVESPSGTVDAMTAADVAIAFEESMAIPTGGNRENPVATQTTEITGICDTGSLTVEAGSSGTSSFSYNNCCLAGCCIDGSGTVFVDTSGSATYSVCASYALNESCDGLSVDVEFSYCASQTGEYIYVIEVEGDTFAVSGSISNGNGSLTITGENGTFTCDYTNYTGTCTDTTGGSFSF